MGRRTLGWIRRNTTVEDLLDDGIENSSDLDSFRTSDEGRHPTLEARDFEAMEIRRATLERAELEANQQLRFQHRKSFSRLGLLLGAALSIAGLLTMAYPKETLVEHSRIKYLPSVVEHVTKNGAVFYGAVLLVFGIALCVYSSYRPRIDD